ncbi:MAG: twin-arginine translocation signal domain-containing protein, partial [Deltaproteobacteria bacterium]|nr:twin-arginine translocation signal domain-containing protein [Deltaproteobacteria bacterium]
MKHHSSRRQFLKSGLALSAVGLLPTCKSQKNKSEEGFNPMIKDAGDQVVLNVLNPRGVLPSILPSGLTAPRLDSLEGKRMILLAGKPDSIVFFDALEALLKERYPTLTIVRSAFFSPTEGEKYDFDAFIEGVKTSGAGRVDNEARLEKMGIPGVTITVDDQLPQRKRLAETNGLPNIRIVTVPAETYFVCECKPAKLKPIAAAAFDDIIEALTSPLTELEKNPQPLVYDYGAIHFEGSSYDEVYEKFQQYCMD